ncbi:MAG: ExbD/TolR family protein [Chthoniobacterales bacterium]
MRRYSNRAHLQTVTELNVTPLLDLAFVLLIIFMITTPLIENSLDLVVPTSSTAKTEVNPAEVQIIAINKDAVIEFNEEPITAADLETRLAGMKLTQPTLAVVVRPHKELPIQQFIAVMDLLQRIGITKVGVMTRPEDKATP